MKSTYKLFTLFILSLSLLFFTSAAVAPAKVIEETPVEKNTLSKKELKKQARKQAKLTRLEARLQKATNDKQKTRIKKRIVATKNGTNEVTTLEILAIIFAVLFPLVGLILAIIAKKNGGGVLATVAFWVSLVLLILIVLYIILAITLFASAATVI
ncbi:MAG: hypothetical protein AB8E82_01305 [Aureispira sp.]